MRSDLLRAFTTIVADHQQGKIEHPTDDLGWPLCQCEPCKEKSERMNAAFIDSILRTGTDPERTLPSNPMAEFDYDGDAGREWQDAQRAQARASSRAMRFEVIEVKAPGIVPNDDGGT